MRCSSLYAGTTIERLTNEIRSDMTSSLRGKHQAALRRIGPRQKHERRTHELRDEQRRAELHRDQLHRERHEQRSRQGNEAKATELLERDRRAITKRDVL